MTKRQQKRLIKLLISLVLLTASYLINKKPPPEILGVNSPGYYPVARFDDGDTIVVNMNGKEEKVRLIGVDTPETHDPRKPVQCYGRAAAAFTRELIGDSPVRLESDALSSNRDRYNRLLRYVFLPDGRLVQAEIIKSGYGFAYTSFPFTKSAEFKLLEDSAKNANIGLWSSCQLTPNEYGGYTPNAE